ncbi:helix-turn-helix transcriptional regulator [Sphingomonas sp. Y38-1Y]|uniref:helix-turn-helix transcriptional regulator n=1 Tax=Sphingomonas sp. Y38-1Y TaxID=3078265 RepID=UPI0028EE7CEF|nr:LuxR C-terminal-related transcriptional regulator [Sphingomonas sp. Y38-1Y]
MPLLAANLPPGTAAFAQQLLEDQRARLVVGPGLSVQWSNAAADRLLGTGRAVANHHDRLQFFHADHERQVAGFVRDLVQIGAMALPLGEDGGWLLFSGRRLPDPQGEYVSLLITPDTELSTPRYHDFESIFGLTASENRIVLALLRGSTADVIASASNVSVMTVRTHLRRIYQKLGVGSREQLLHRLNRYRYE